MVRRAVSDTRARIEHLLVAERRYTWWWTLIFVALAARVGWAAWITHAHPSAVTNGDSPGYLGPARALVQTRHFSLSPDDATPMFLRTPGYPALLAVILWVTGSQQAISPIQAALSVLPVLVTVIVARKVIGPTAAMVAGAVVALDPLQFSASGTILTESLATLTLVGIVAVGLVVFAPRTDRVRPRVVAALGTVTAAAIMVRPTMYFFPIVVLVFLAFRFRDRPRRRLLALLLAFAMPIVIVAGGWQVRNHYAVNSWQIAGAGAVTIYCYDAAAVQAKVANNGMAAARRQLGCNPTGWDNLAKACPTWWGCDVPHPLGRGKSFDEMNRRGLHILARNPLETAQVAFKGLGRETLGPGTDTVRRFLHASSSPALTIALFSWTLLLWTLALVGVFVALRSRLRAFWAFDIGIVVYVMAASAGAEADARFRTPIVPLLALLAAVGAQHLVRRVREQRFAGAARP
ncbi:MAG: hypothetical protein QOH28_3012 [Actinomycetota bacterium]|nr:hypothetical protein [Actinomycetota bacterium]